MGDPRVVSSWVGVPTLLAALSHSHTGSQVNYTLSREPGYLPGW